MLVVRAFTKDRPINVWRKGFNKSQHETRLANYLKMLKNKFSAETIHNTPQEKSVHFFFGQLLPGCRIHMKCTIIPALNQISFVSQLYKDGKPVKIKSKPLTLLMCRLCNKLNETSKYFVAQVDIVSRVLSIRQSTIYTTSQFQLYTNDDKISENYFARQINSAKVCVQFNLPFLMELIGQPQYIEHARRCDPKCYLEREKEGEQQCLQRLGKILLACDRQAAFMHLQNLKKNNKKEEIEIEKIRKNDMQKARQMVRNAQDDTKIREVMRHYTQNTEVVYTMPETSGTYPQNYTRMLVMKEERAVGQNLYIFQKITLPEKIQLSPIYNDGQLTNYEQSDQVQFAFQMEKVEDLMTMKISKEEAIQLIARFETRRVVKQNEVVKRRLAINVNNDAEKSIHEKKTLTQLSYCCCQFISRSYFTTSGPFADKMIVEYQEEGSIDQYFKKNKLTSTILTKLYMLQLVGQGLRYLHDQNIFKRQLKRSDILVNVTDHRLITKLRNFTSAYYSKSKYDHGLRNVQAPYCPPQAFSKQPQQVTQKQDVFCYGVLICQVLFQANFFSIMNEDALADCYSSGQYYRRILVCPEKLSDLGPDECIQKIGRFLLKCLSPDPSERPCIDWMVIFLKELIDCIISFY